MQRHASAFTNPAPPKRVTLPGARQAAQGQRGERLPTLEMPDWLERKGPEISG